MRPSFVILLLLAGCGAAGSPRPAAPPAEVAAAADHVHHAVDYVEIAATDMAAARRFYGAAFGWQFTEYGPTYVGFRLGEGREMGGLRAEEAPPAAGGPLVVLFSADLDATLEAVRAAGGEVVTEPFDFPGGRRFHFRDPSGNELAVWAAP